MPHTKMSGTANKFKVAEAVTGKSSVIKQQREKLSVGREKWQSSLKGLHKK